MLSPRDRQNEPVGSIVSRLHVMRSAGTATSMIDRSRTRFASRIVNRIGDRCTDAGDADLADTAGNHRRVRIGGHRSSSLA